MDRGARRALVHEDSQRVRHDQSGLARMQLILKLYHIHLHLFKTWVSAPCILRTFQPVGAEEESSRDIQIQIP